MGTTLRSQKIGSLFKDKNKKVYEVGSDFKERFNEKKCQKSGPLLSKVLDEVYEGFPDCAYGSMRRTIFRSIETKIGWMNLLEELGHKNLTEEDKEKYREFFKASSAQ